MKKFLETAKTYILLASIYPEGANKTRTPFDLNYKVFPTYIEIQFNDKSMLIYYDKSTIHFFYSDMERVDLSLCGRRTGFRQSYLITLNIKCKNDLSLNIETYDYTEAINLYTLIKSKKIKTSDINNIVALIKNYKTTTDIYDYINENSQIIFKKNPKDKKRISYLVSDL